MLWLCLHFAQLALELLPPQPDSCVAITDQRGSRRWLLVCNAASRKAGLHHGLDAAGAMARVPSLKLIERSKPREQASLKALAGWAEQYSSFVCLDAQRWLLWIEIGASLNYFGGLPKLMQDIEQGIASLGYTARCGVAPTLEAAAVMTAVTPSVPILQPANLSAALAPLPLNCLSISHQVMESLRGIGWHTVGEVLAIPVDQLARRFGPQLPQYLQRLMGEQADPRERYRAPAHYRRRFELAAPIEAVEALLFPLRRMLGELQGYLRARDTALQVLRLVLGHDSHADAHTVIELHTSTPQRDAACLLALLRERLERTTLVAPIIKLTVSVDQFTPLGDTQHDLFDTTQRDNAWNTLLDKLRARLGDRAVHRLGLNDDHRPEKAWCILRHDAAGASSGKPATHPDRPLWLLKPTLLERLPRLLGKPERIEAGWWSGEEVRRDYYIAETTEGSRWWLYRDANTAQWYLQGLWS